MRAFRKNVMKSGKFVKVAADGAPYLRKVDLEMYNSYQQLLSVLENLFSCFPIRTYSRSVFLCVYTFRAHKVFFFW